jgi:RNA-dependent RNA polymerase
MINEIRSTLTSEKAACELLKKTYPSYYKDIIFMLEHGVSLTDDAYLRGMINAFFLSNFKLIKSKARIFAPDSKLLMGVLDEYGCLEYGEVFIQISEDRDSKVIEHRIAIGKNPCYHPGDIRVLNAVSRPQLMHLHNVVVFPQKGPRPHPNECSGSDLDGDLYFVTWNPLLIPEESKDAMNYISPAELNDSNPSMVEKVIDFFATFMASENIGRISNAHLIWADSKGIFSEEALELARLTSVAVDYPKTGIPAELPQKLRINRWPDFMEKSNKMSYPSQGIIGVLWRDCVLEDFDYRVKHEMDRKRLFNGYEKFLSFAKELYSFYVSKMQKLVHQYDSQNELFLITGQTGENSRRKMRYDDDIQIQNLVSCYREEVLKMFCLKSNSLTERRQIASASYFVAYSKKKKTFLSFPWIFHEYLIIN